MYVDVYELILQEGCIGALKYANQIESKNYRLASDIDLAVNRIYNNTRFAQTPQQSNPFPNFDPNRDLTAPNNNTGTQTTSTQIGNAAPPNTVLPNNLVGTFGGSVLNGATIDAGRIQAFKRGLATWYNARLGQYTQLLKQGNYIEAGKILNNSPKDLGYLFSGNGYAIRSRFLDAAKQALGGPGDARYVEFIHDAAGLYAQDAAKAIANKGVGGLLGKIIPTQQKAGVFLHPGLQGLPNSVQGVTYGELRGLNIQQASQLMAKKDLEQALSQGLIQQDEYLQMVNESPSAIQSLLRQLKAPTANLDALAQHLTQDGLKASEQLLTNAAPSNVGKLEGILSKISGMGSKFGFLGEILHFGGKILGPLAVILDAKGFFDEFQEYGFDGKTICDLCSLILGCSSLIPALTPFAGPAWLIVSVGCFFVQHGKPLKDQQQSDTQTNQNSSQSTQNSNATTLSQHDQQLYDSLAQQNPNTDQFNAMLQQAIDSGQFQNPDLAKTMTK